MLEILFLIWFARKLAGIATEKGRSGAWGALGVLFWIAGEVFGFLLAARAGVGTGGMYLGAILCALLGAAVAFGIVSSLKSLRELDFPRARVVDRE